MPEKGRVQAVPEQDYVMSEVKVIALLIISMIGLLALLETMKW